MTLELLTANNREYAFTLRRTNLKVQHTEQMYRDHLQKFTEKAYCTLKDIMFETTGGLHCHGILSIPSGVSMKRFRVRGWNIKLVELYDQLGWTEYYMKESKHTNDQADLEEEMKEVNKITSLNKKLF